ncbi:hypothetical protein EDB89DRAFT_1901144 [Lactarius sanguifluus]|nr:hypothetical protein EDB89DRAFT_1901144 [Lactarius sanguifluus]
MTIESSNNNNNNNNNNMMGVMIRATSNGVVELRSDLDILKGVARWVVQQRQEGDGQGSTRREGAQLGYEGPGSLLQGCDTLYNLVQPPQVGKLTSPQAMSNSSQASYRAMTHKFRKSYKYINHAIY